MPSTRIASRLQSAPRRSPRLSVDADPALPDPLLRLAAGSEAGLRQDLLKTDREPRPLGSRRAPGTRAPSVFLLPSSSSAFVLLVVVSFARRRRPRRRPSSSSLFRSSSSSRGGGDRLGQARGRGALRPSRRDLPRALRAAAGRPRPSGRSGRGNPASCDRETASRRRSLRPAVVMSFFSKSVFSTDAELTPRISWISGSVIGWRYAMMASVSSAASERRLRSETSWNLRSRESNSGPRDEPPAAGHLFEPDAASGRVRSARREARAPPHRLGSGLEHVGEVLLLDRAAASRRGAPRAPARSSRRASRAGARRRVGGRRGVRISSGSGVSVALPSDHRLRRRSSGKYPASARARTPPRCGRRGSRRRPRPGRPGPRRAG